MDLQQPPQTLASPPDSAGQTEDKRTSPIMVAIRAVLGWMTPHKQMSYLRKKEDINAWERFRDSLIRLWSNLNVICGLIMGSLIVIGFGVGLIYVLGDVKGSSLLMIDQRHPVLYLFALSIPEVWAFISFGTFFADVGVIVWQAADKGWIVKESQMQAGVAVSAVALIGHLAAFAFPYREQDTTEFLIPDDEVIISDVSLASVREAKEVDKGKARSSILGESARPPRRHGMSSAPFASSQTLVASPTSQSLNIGASAQTRTAPETMERSLIKFVMEPAGEMARLSR
ncbi:hypothetical protein EW145_g725 [Phellinidium pouzarii]|uniref:Uncharacterized protein n=1 Tax=Phellinidium pouzarii TaxID=167371 RepID=A0A4S4LMS9_9AGAM|nr:hypothetical protein EW145_g725 [Phellinidium pouzarii]